MNIHDVRSQKMTVMISVASTKSNKITVKLKLNDLLYLFLIQYTDGNLLWIF